MQKFFIQDRALTLPIEVRAARSAAATFVVPAGAAQALLSGTGLEIAEILPGKAVLSIASMRYEDSDLDSYNEVGIAFVVRLHDAEPATSARRSLEVARNRAGVYIHHLPVDQTFTLEAGRTIWGYPKFLADIDIQDDPKRSVSVLRHDGAHVLTLTVRKGIRPWPAVPNLPTYTFNDGLLRRTEWRTTAEGTRGRVGGATLELGTHPIAEELRSLGLPKRAMVSTTIDRVRASFGEAQIVRPAAATVR